ncbi:hypothetical protein CAEBREN_21104 [Caenorhabditis brenneri]|uniref:Piwi domain-containing protein n=1 Tax=Caenorhabditis brenneri TaxID=135651 RepID=G0NQP0_CAEBE|nr:hypothetical protein CAEBREN_21104 [Caenorhabditis brenneri]
MSGFRIPKRPRPAEGGAAPSSTPSSSSSSGPPISFSRPTDTPTGLTFQPIGSSPITTNVFKVDTRRMPNSFTRLSMETHLCGGKIEFKLSEGIVGVSGGINSTDRRHALISIFRKLIQRHPDIFGTNLHMYTFDQATTIYAVEGNFKGQNKKYEEKFERKDFTDQEWLPISKIIRRENTWFKVVLSSNGVVYSHGEKAMSEKNRQELTRLIECVTSEVLNTPDFLQYGSQTFPLTQAPVFKPDPTSEIRAGFDKGIRLLEGSGKEPEIAMTIDTKLSPFYASTSLLKFFIAKYSEFKGVGGSGQIRHQRHSGERGGRPGGRRDQQRDRSRSRSPGRGGSRSQHQEDYDPKEVLEVQTAFNNGKDENLFRRIEDAMKTLCVSPTHLDKAHNRNIIVLKLGKSASETYFDMHPGTDQQQRINVAEYFLLKYNYRLKFPNLPLVATGRVRNVSHFPMELLWIVPGQRIKSAKMSATVQSSMTGQNATLPREHIQRIQEILRNHLRFDRNPHMATFKIDVAREPIQMNASLISAPQIRFESKCTASMNPGAVSFRQKNNTKFSRPAKIGKIAVVAFDTVNTDLEKFCERLYGICQSNGIDCGGSWQHWIRLRANSNDTTRIKKEMAHWQSNGVTLFLGITPEKKPDVHDLMKYFEASLGLQTLQIHINTADCFVREKGGAQTVENVMRKLNLKCGGVNFTLEIPDRSEGKSVCSNVTYAKQKMLDNVQFIGFEMTHGSARTLFDRNQGTFDGEPTIVGCSYSLKVPTDLGGFMYLQEMNEYRLKNLDTKFCDCFNAYQKASGSLPKTIVVYRTGVGEGDYKRVQEEIQDMKKAMEKISGDKPKLIVIVVQKTSHIRIFPKEIKGTKAVEQNVRSGTMVDGQITTAGRNEFILVSQTALIGTVRPIKYTIMTNEANWSKNELIHATYFLAFGHQVSYGPPAIPHVLYGAENLAKRGRNNFLTHKRLGELNQQVQKVLTEYDGLQDEEHQKELDSVLIDNITEAVNAMAVDNKNFWA